ncbi:uncharacterized protein VTP21DRAFT_4237 [Calcarisporiella thermophila]|uniref:uncharacterized protein n=1 Tax=Calcarisporiella thermophila TaxID=911321 RepID=UPI003741FFB6
MVRAPHKLLHTPLLEKPLDSDCSDRRKKVGKSKEREVRVAVIEDVGNRWDNRVKKRMVFNIMIEDSRRIVALSRNAHDLFSLNDQLRSSKGVKMPPSLPSFSAERRRSFLFTSLFQFKQQKSNTEKVEAYITSLLAEPALANLECVKEFLKPRENDSCFYKEISKSAVKESKKRTKTVADVPLKRPRRMAAPPISEVTLDDFEIIKVLGKGCMGKVLFVRKKHSNQMYALKAIQKEWVIMEREMEHTMAERNILASIACTKNPFLMQLHYAFQTNDQLFLVMDFHPGGDLASQLAQWYKFDPERARLYAAEIVLGLEELHRLGVVYRDLKPENILIARDGHIVLTDYGLSKKFNQETLHMNIETRTSTFCGTAEYLAPEVLRAEPYSYAVDWWSFGTLLYEMLAGFTPFWAETQQEMFQRILQDDIEFPAEGFNDSVRDFIKKLLHRDPARRLGSQGVDDIKNHPYFHGLNWNSVMAKRFIPPFVPSFDGDLDLSHFDDVFLEMEPRLSIPKHAIDTTHFRKLFAGYEFNGMMHSESRPKKRRAREMEEENAHLEERPMKIRRQHVYSGWNGPFRFEIPPQYNRTQLSLRSTSALSSIRC